MKLNLFKIMVLAFFCVSSATAQTRLRNAKHRDVDTVSVFVRSYADSLKCYKEKLDSVPDVSEVDADSVEPKSAYYRFFVPLTFYHNVTSSFFSLEPDANESEKLQNDYLLSMYLHRPDLVQSTQSQLDKVGPLIDAKPAEVVSDADIMERVAPKPEETEIAQVDILVKKPNFWKFYGDYTLQMFQNYISSNWYKGGESNYSALATLTLQANYNNKQRFRWENKLEMRLGFQNSRSDTLHTVKTSEDLLRYTGKIGLQATKRWYYTLQVIASTQFMRGLKSNDKNIYSDFLSPLNINPSIGMDYSVDWFKGRLKGSVHIAPFAYNLKYVKRAELATRYGLEEGKHTKSDFGSEITLDLNWQFTKDIRWKTRLYGYTTYKRALLEWENTFTFVVNKYISSNVFVYPRFDDGTKRDFHHGYWQFKEYVSLGFAYSF